MTMFKLLLVDDELAILNGLYGNVDWFDLGIDEVYRAQDVATALQILESSRVDVVITDICMPDFSGLEMSEGIKKKWPMVKIILLSGHREFLYAKKGVELGVYGYITKPVSYGEIADIVAEAIRKIEAELNQAAVLREAEEKIRTASDVLRERFLNRWITRGILPEHETEMLLRCGFPKDLNEEATLILFRRDSERYNSWDFSFLEYMLPGITQSITADRMRLLSFADRDDNLVIIVRGETKEELCSVYSKFNSILDVVQLSIQKTFGEMISIFWGSVVSLKELSFEYKKIRLRMNRGLCLGEGVLSGPEDKKLVQEGGMLEALLLYPTLPMLVENLQKEQAQVRIKEIFSEIRRKKWFSTEIFLSIYHTVTSIISEDSIRRGLYGGNGGWQQGLEEFFMNFGSVHSIEELEERCTKAVVQYISYVKGTELHLAGNLAKNIKEYIKKNLSKPLAVSEIAEQFGYNASYLTRIFKKETGFSLNDYIIHARMEKAKELLKIPGERVNGISLEVGYENVSHFSRLFKKLNGVSPKQYQSL